MPKLKTIKAVAKRFRITKNGKVLKKKCGQDHYNSRESGKVSRNKRRPTKLSDAFTRNVKGFLPNH
ncbi:MAG: 50S ribosomal protein L35 [Patescibacteria group bacterium]